jgi:protein SCO1
MTRMALLLILLAFDAGAARAELKLPRSLHGVGFDQKLNDQVPLDLTFRDEQGRTVRLGEYFRGKPVILVLAQYRCPMLCTQVLNGLVRGMLDIPFNAGKEFEVVTVSFDSRETPEMAAAKKKTYLERYGRPGAEEGWHFLTGDEEPIRRLTDAVGFRYTYDARNDQFAHASGIIILTPEGRIFRYIFDVDFSPHKTSPRDLRLSLVEASQNRIGTPIDQVMLYCFHYDPAEGKYGAAIMNILRGAGVATVLGIGLFMGLLWRREWVLARRASEGHPSLARRANS